ncbi:probable tetraacyldisaccharide 4'-kinase, mitochondrial isoform X2 [Triticum dicoccoides]|uniref:probable tetraacyldisaccharide 4'-kinase, mitochondrial isoform X2 n=1 Tax=Triticum dicoccoides TaxID=85692 RepID=UPI00188E340E|nr:probable tetraacyldisaccharide 4'-kinase, mitochondrial isoform X2 [Triticum dicoccoides]
MATEKARQLLARLAATPDAAVPNLPFLHRALLLPLLSAASALLRLPVILSSSPLRSRRTLPVPVISVGNLTWGGNGKTPMVDFLARRFHSMGISPLILTRGYAGGDESKMLRRRLADTSTKIGVGANRAAVGSSMLQKYGHVDPCDAFRREKLGCNRVASGKSAKIGVAILDDGMQHRSLLRDVEIVMVNGLTPWGNTHFIPRGPMREPLSALTRADIVVIHHADLACEAQLETIARTVQDSGTTCSVFFSKLAPSHIFEVHQPLQKISLNVLGGMIVLCVSAIGCPDAFIHTVREDLELIQERVRQLVDQHNKETVVLVTEKDYDRDPDVLRMLGVKVWVLSSSLQIMALKEQGEDELLRKLKDIITATRHVVQP